jgi:hypothetical protein
MKNFYIEQNGQQSEAISFEDLKQKKITRNTLVWYEGLQGWQKAGELDELQELFKSQPPPIKKDLPPNLPRIEIQEENRSFFSENKYKLALVSLVLVISLAMFFSFSNKDKTELENQTIENSYVINQQQKQLLEQQTKIAEQERIERERAEREKDLRIKELTIQIIAAEQRLEEAKKQINDASAFQLLRSNSQRNDDINAANENMERVKNELDKMVTELHALSPE